MGYATGPGREWSKGSGVREGASRVVVGDL